MRSFMVEFLSTSAEAAMSNWFSSADALLDEAEEAVAVAEGGGGLMDAPTTAAALNWEARFLDVMERVRTEQEEKGGQLQILYMADRR